jgi:hypothetical protein
MERASDKHGPRVDEQMAHETEGTTRAGKATHVEEWRDPEPSGEDQPDVDRAPGETLVGGTPPGMTEADVELRSEVASSLGKDVWPATGAALRERAQDARAPDRVQSVLARLDPAVTYRNVQEVWTALGGGVERRRV